MPDRSALRRDYEEDLNLLDRLDASADGAAEPGEGPCALPRFGSDLPRLTARERAYFDGVWAKVEQLEERTSGLARGGESIGNVAGGMVAAGAGVVGGILGAIGFLVAGAVPVAALNKADQKRIEQRWREVHGRIARLEKERAELDALMSAWSPAERALAEAARVLRGKQRSHPALPKLDALWPASARRFSQRTWSEIRLAEDDDYQDLLRDQVCDWEHHLRGVFLTESDALVDTVLAGLKAGTRGILEEHFRDGAPHTLFVLEHWLVGLRRQLNRGDGTATRWVTRTFEAVTRRFEGEELDTERILTRGPDNLGHFVGRLRKQYRNRLAHGLSEPFDHACHAHWCDFAYGTNSLHQWLDVGVSPLVHDPASFGWLSFLTFALRSAPR